MTLSFPDEIQHYEKKIYDQRQLIEISRALNSTLDYQYLIQAILDICLAQVQTLQAALFLTADMDADEIVMVEDKGFDLGSGQEEALRLKLDSPLVEYLSEVKSSLSLGDLKANIGPVDPESIKLLRQMGAELIVPFRFRARVIGMIVLGEKATGGGEYPSSERAFLYDLASLGAIAVENARLYERATTDMMTGLKNHAYFQTRMKEEREKAHKRKVPLSLLLTDVDKFKAFNDTYGHQAGDEVLRHVASALQSVARKNDTAARYGGEEFCMILPGLDEAEAREVAEAVRKRIEETVILYNGDSLSVTMSIGISSFDAEKDSRTNQAMVERADQALYSCKDLGRNMVRCYSELDS